MRNSVKKILSIVLVVFITGSLLAACGSSKQAGNSADTSKATTQSSGTAAPAEDFKAKVSTYTLLAPLFVALPQTKDEKLYQMIKEQFGIDWNITWVSSNDYTTKFQTVLASGDIPDAIVSTDLLNASLNQGITDGYFADLTKELGDFSKYPNLLKNSTKNAFNYVKSTDGKIMAIPRNRADLEMVFYMRKDWMDKAGYTVDKIKTVWDWKNAIIDIAKKDPDGNGKNDTLGYAAWSYNLGNGYLTDNMASAFGAYNGQKDKDGGLYHFQMTDGFIDYINFAREMYKDGAVSNEFSVLNLSEANDLFNAGRAVSYVRTGTYGWGYEKNLKQNLGVKDAEVIALPYLKGTNNNTTAVKTTGVYGAYYLNSKLKEYDIKKLLNFYEKTNNEEWHTYAFYGMKDRDYTVDANGTKVATKFGADTVQQYQSLQQVVMTIANAELKLISTSAPKEFNDKIINAAKTYLQPEANATINHFRAINSSTWKTTWPKYQSTYEKNTAKAIVGEMSMDEYKKYITDLREQPDIKKCSKEFADSDKLLFPSAK